MKLDNLSTTSSQPSSSCTLKTSSSSSGWSLATTSRQCPTTTQTTAATRSSPISSQQQVANNKKLLPIPTRSITTNAKTSISSRSSSITNSSSSNSGDSTTTTTAISRRTRQQRQQQYCAGNKFHRAAIDGYVDMLCTVSKRDTNCHAQDDFLQLTPTLLAAQAGQLEALRILVGRGGDPERVSSLGSSALHLAASRDHLNCVSFLVNFGANMWALDNELRTAKDIAALGQCTRVLEYLDQMMAKQSAINTKLVQKLKDKAKVAAEKRLKQMRKQQMKAIKQVERDERLLAKLSNNRRLLKSAHSTGDIKLVGRNLSGGGDGDHQHHQHQLAMSTAISFSPNDPLDVVSMSTSGSGGGGGGGGPSLSGSKMVANFLSSRFQCAAPSTSRDEQRLVARAAAAACASAASASVSSHNSAPNSDLNSSSYCSSSVSSASGGVGGSYLSSCSARSILKSALASRATTNGRSGGDRVIEERDSNSATDRRPRYSDLVALNQSAAADVRRTLRGGGSANSSDEFAGIKSTESRLTSRLRGLSGGVSRKVHLKRLLFASAVTSSSSSSSNDDDQPLGRQSTRVSGDDHSSLISRQRARMAIGERMGERLRHADCEPSSAQLCLKRARSEPDFGTALQVEQDEDERDHMRRGRREQDQDSEPDIPTPPPEPPGPSCKDDEEQCHQQQQQQQQQHRHEDPTSGHQASNDKQLDHGQQHLLTKCLSQLKFQQQHQHGACKQQPTPAAAINSNCNGSQKQQKSLCTSNSDELIRHQLNASEFPLRPSIIKQQLHVKQQRGEHTALDKDGGKRTRQKSTTIMSVDSIGSAGSFVQRNTSGPTSSHAHHSTGDNSFIRRHQTAQSQMQQQVSYDSHHNHNHNHNHHHPHPHQAQQVAGRCESSGEQTNASASTSSGLSAGSSFRGSSASLGEHNDDGEKQDATNNDDHRASQPPAAADLMAAFLASNNLLDLADVLAQERIDLEALLLLNEADLKSLNILLGPRRKLLNAIEHYKALAAPKHRPPQGSIAQPATFTVVDTQF